ncbi:MAG: DUF1570 domain-containing protein [Planctomycetota bacterium]
MRVRLSAILFGWLVLSAHAAGGQAPDAGPGLTAYATTHYHLHTNLSRREAVPYGRHLDAVYEQYAERFARYGDRPAGRMDVYLFRTRAQYLHFLETNDVAAHGSGGVFFVTHDLRGLATWTDGHPRRQTFRTLQHEGFHQFAWHHFGPQLPHWVNEGLAQYFEDAVPTATGLSLGLADAGRVERVRDAITRRRTLSFAAVANSGRAEWLAALRYDPDHAGLLYAQSWSLVYFLIHGEGGRHRPAFEDYLRRLAEGETDRDAFTAAFGGVRIATLETRWRAYAHAQTIDEAVAAAEELVLLGEALLLLHRRDEPLPRHLNELRQRMTALGVAVTRRVDGAATHVPADDELFTYRRPGGEASEYLLLEPAAAGLPPRLAAPGLSPEPTLIWQAGPDAEPRYDVTYR